MAEAAARDIERIAELEHAQSASRTLAAIVEASEDAILSKGLDGIITSWNRGAEKLFGYQADEAIGQSMLMLFPPGKEAEEALILDRIKRGETIGHFDTQRLAKTGRLIDVSVTISPVLNRAGEVVGASKIARDITQSKKAEAELVRHREAHERLMEREKFITTVTDHLPGMVGYWDQELRCRFANLAYFDWFGHTPEEIVGMSLPDLIGAEAFEQSRTHIEAALAGQPTYFDRAIRKPSGEIGYGLTHYIPDQKDGVVVGFFALVTDVTSLKIAEDQLRETNGRLGAALAEAKDASTAKSQFLANMSHELRTPLNAILGFAQLLASETLKTTPEQKKDSVNRILKAGRHLLTLIKEILDLAKIEAGHVALSPEPVALADILHECQAMMEPLGNERSIRMIFPETCDLNVIADRTRLKQVLLNLLSNAVKYNREAGVIVVDCVAASPDRVRISVRDTGQGLDEASVAKLFQPFERLGYESGSVEGTGIGLVVTKHLVELMEGSIGVSSTVGTGTVFWLEFKSAEPASPRVLDEGSAAQAPIIPLTAGKATLLYVEDNPANLVLVEEVFRSRDDLCVLSAPDGLLGVQLARAHQPDVILMDIHLPGMSGEDAQRILRDDPKTAHIPVIALTASAMPREIEKGLAAGFFRYVTKPIDLDELIEAVDSALMQGHEGAARPAANDQGGSP